MNNQIRRQLLERHRASGFPGSIMDVFSAYNQGIDLIADFQQQQQQQVRQQQLQQLQQAQQAQQQEQQVVVAETPEEQAEGLRPYHAAGNTNQTMVFPNVPANTPFNTVGMKAPINIEKYNNQGHLIESFKNVPPGIQSLPTGSQEGIVIETPANMKTGGRRKYQPGGEITTLQPRRTPTPTLDLGIRPETMSRSAAPQSRYIDPIVKEQNEADSFAISGMKREAQWADPNQRAAMTSGRAESVSPATYVTPAGDLQGIIESGAQIAEGNYLEGGLGAGLAAASVLLPGTIRVPNSAQDLFEAANVFKKYNITKADEAGDLVSRAAYNNTGMSEELANAAGTINIAANNARQLYRDIYPNVGNREISQNKTYRLINTVLADYPQLAVTYNTGMMNSPEVASAVQDFGRQYLTSFRGVRAKNLDEAAEFLTSPFGKGDRIHGPGIYTTSNSDILRNYGNYKGELMARNITPNMSGKEVMGTVRDAMLEGSHPYYTDISRSFTPQQYEQIINSLIGNPQFGNTYEQVVQNVNKTFGQPVDNRRGIFDTGSVRVITGTGDDRIVPTLMQVADASNFSPITIPIWQERWSGEGPISKYFFQKQGFKKYGGLLRSGSVRKYQGGGSKNVDPFSSFEVAKQNNMAKKEMIKRADGSYSQRGLWDNIRANKGSGKKPTAAMLKQEKKIKAKTRKK